MPRPLPNPTAKRSRAGSKRHVAGWVLLTLGLLVAAVWYRSSRTPFPWKRGHWNFFVFDGALTIVNDPWEYEPNYAKSLYDVKGKLNLLARTVPFRRMQSTWDAWIVAGYGYEPLGIWIIVLWPLPLLLWTTGGLALWSGRRARKRVMANHCPTCGYNLAGLVTGAACPECGNAMRPTSRAD